MSWNPQNDRTICQRRPHLDAAAADAAEWNAIRHVEQSVARSFKRYQNLVVLYRAQTQNIESANVSQEIRIMAFDWRIASTSSSEQ